MDVEATVVGDAERDGVDADHHRPGIVSGRAEILLSGRTRVEHGEDAVPRSAIVPGPSRVRIVEDHGLPGRCGRSGHPGGDDLGGVEPALPESDLLGSGAGVSTGGRDLPAVSVANLAGVRLAGVHRCAGDDGFVEGGLSKRHANVPRAGRAGGRFPAEHARVVRAAAPRVSGPARASRVDIKGLLGFRST